LRAAGKRAVLVAPPPHDGSEITACWERRLRGQVTRGGRNDCEIAIAPPHARHYAHVAALLEQAAPVADVPMFGDRP